MDAVKLTLVGVLLLAAGCVAMLSGVLLPSDVVVVADRVLPILGFVVAITVVAELSARAGIFDAVAAVLARVSRGRIWVLWVLVLMFGVVATAFLSLDTTAVLLTPIVIVLARSNGLPVLPFAMATVVIANTASLTLPVSNLTNLLATDLLARLGDVSFLTLMGAASLAAIVVSASVLGIKYRRSLAGHFTPMNATRPADILLFRLTAVVVVALLPFLVVASSPWVPASIAAGILILLFLWRRPGVIRLTLVPWSLLVFASGLFLATAAAEALGSAQIVAAIAGEGENLLDLMRLSFVSAATANLIDNLPAYLAMEPAATSAPRVGALLIGVNAGPLITPWASLATLLWYQRLSAMDVKITWRSFVLTGLVVAPLTVAASALVLFATT